MYKLIPNPKEIVTQQGNLEIQLPFTICHSNNDQSLISIMQNFLKTDWGLEFPVESAANSEKFAKSQNKIEIGLDTTLLAENYVLDINEEGISIKGGDNAAIFYGFQTLRQIFFNIFTEHQQKGILGACRIVDSPRFSWRGFMLDEGRYFLGKKTVKKVLDWMALLKFNRLHWHLTEDQGWRIEILKYPKLTTIGSKRAGTPKYRNINIQIDGIPHEGFYTQNDVKEIIAYAKERFIEIIPEIEMPGHAVSALAAYPEFSCTGGPFEVASHWGVHKDVFCVGNPNTIPFLKDILKEVIDLFPSPWIHIGGDEVPKDRWKACRKCQNKIKSENLDDEHNLQVAFTNEMVEFLAQHNKKAIVWNEVTDARLDPRTITQFWRGSFDPIIDFLKLGGKTVISPSRDYYVDVAYHITPLSRTYNFEPVREGTAIEISQQILGVEAEMWGEVFQSEEKMEFCAFPRTFAIAETAWAPQSGKNYGEFVKTLEFFLALWTRFGIKFTSLKEAEPIKWAKIQGLFKKGFGHYL